MVPVAPSQAEIRAALRKRITEACRRDLSKAFVWWLLREAEPPAELAMIAAVAAKQEGADQDFQTVAILGFAADAGLLPASEIAVLKNGLGRVAGRAPIVNGVPMGFSGDPVAILGVALGATVVAHAETTRRVADWAAQFLKCAYERDRAEDWERCLFAAADRRIGNPVGLPIPTSAAVADVRIALLSVDLLDHLDMRHRQDAALTLALAEQDVPKEFGCERAALRLKALEWAPNVPVQAWAAEELSLFNSSENQDLRNGPDVHIFWGPFWTGGVLSFRNEGTEAAKNVRIECSAESGWRPVLRPEVIASISPGAIARVIDETGQTLGHGRSIADFVHSLSSKEHMMTVSFEDRLGEKRERDFRVVAAGTYPVTEALAVTFYPMALRKIGVSDSSLRHLVDRMRVFRDAAEMSKILNRSGLSSRIQVAQPDPVVAAQDQRVSGKARRGKKSVRRNTRYEEIDRALREISEARPKNHEEVFRFLDERKVSLPGRKLFKAAGGWLKGFQQNRAGASAWLSQAWARLDLPSFARGPKK